VSVKLTVMIPTFGRHSVVRVVKEALAQFDAPDQVIVTTDGPVSWLTADYFHDPRVIVHSLYQRVGDFGCTPLDAATPLATGQFIWYMGDDDFIPEGAIAAIKKGVLQDLYKPHIFAMFHTNRILSHSIDLCQVSGQQIVVPNMGKLLPRWQDFTGDVHVSDWDWIDRVAKAFGGVVYHHEMVCILKKQNFGAA